MGSATTRREFLETTTGLVISFALPWRADATVVRAAAPPPFAPNAWLRIGTDGTVTLTIDRSEMGQGAQTGLAIILAEELEADWSTIRLGPMPENPAGWSRIMRTGGSNAIRSSWEPLRKAGATAREMLLTADRAKAMPGVRHVVALEPSSWMGANGAWAAGCAAGVAVVADTYWQALQARRALEIEWDEGDSGALDSPGIRAQLVALADQPGIVAQTIGDATAALAGAAKRLDATYDVPLLHHATLEPMNCTAHVRAGECDVWAPTQNQGDAQRVAAEVSGLPKEKVRIHTTPSGGGFGRRLEPDFVSEAVRVSQAAGVPVKVVWTREDDMRNGFNRPTSYNRFSAGLDASGRLVAWTHRIAGTPLRLKFGPLAKGIDDSLVDGAIDLPYAIPNVLVDQLTLTLPNLPLGPWRSVGVSHNGFVTECFLDEIAAAAGRDPFELRRELLRDKPRHRRTLELAAEKAGWGSPLPHGRSRGIALAEWGPTVCVEVAEVSLDADGSVHVPRVVCAVDCGQAVNTGQVEAQMQGGVVFGLSAALYGEITLDKGRVVQGNFDTYPVVRMPEAPAVEVYIVPSSDPQGGAGEPGVPPIAPAVCNAIFAATGKRIRKLPIGKMVST